jgi:prepilin-type N-terminal cleavage/methylation domain-containing protein
MSKNRQFPKACQGFTTVELMVVLALVGLIAATTFNVLNKVVPRWRVRQAAMDVAGAVRATRVQAIMELDEVVMPINISQGRYILYSRMAPGEAKRISNHSDPDPFSIVELPEDVRFIAPDGSDPVTLEYGTGAEPVVAFNAQGRLVSSVVPGFIIVGNPQRQIYRRIGVELCGNVQIQRWSQGGWE